MNVTYKESLKWRIQLGNWGSSCLFQCAPQAASLESPNDQSPRELQQLLS